MANEQIAHDLAVARMAGKQVTPDVLVDEYLKAYKEILEYLRSKSLSKKPAKIMNSPF